MTWSQDMAQWAQDTLTFYEITPPQGETWEDVVRKLSSLEEDMWALRGRIVGAINSTGVDQLELDAFELAATSLFNASLFTSKGLVAAGIPKASLPQVYRIPEIRSDETLPVTTPGGGLSGSFGAIAYREGMSVKYPEFAAGFGWAQLALAWFGGAVLLLAAGGVATWAVLNEMSPDANAAAVEATRAQVSVVTAIRESQDDWDGLCHEVLSQGGVCNSEIGDRPPLPVTNLGDIGRAAPTFPWVVRGGAVLLGGATLGLITYVAYRLWPRHR